MQDLLALQQEAWMLRKRNFPNSIQFDYPEGTKVVSLTGSSCELQCAHCGGHYLKNMIPALDYFNNSPKQGKSVLISGGCNSDGTVPLKEHWKYIASEKQRKKVNLHTGLISEMEAAQISEIADVISFDYLGDNETIKEVYGLNATVADYRASYNNLSRQVKVLPHICIGIRSGELSGEFNALKMLKEDGACGIVFIVFTPTKNTKFQDKSPPKLEEVGKVIATARKMFPDIPIHLGCMRPRGRYRAELDLLALKCGVNKIVMPTKAVVEAAEAEGLTITKGEECCVL
ncbi:hypothetical protein GGQ84_001171 [Desulfitispora alkaliphila]|uniref:radical SAM protein n=1 Tax=Desulfitispora alkaliphila TaxID=622674 RepID=UPI003D24A6DA